MPIKNEVKQHKVKESIKPVLAEYKSLIDSFKETIPRSNNPISDALCADHKTKGLPSSTKASLGFRPLESNNLAQQRLKY